MRSEAFASRSPGGERRPSPLALLPEQQKTLASVCEELTGGSTLDERMRRAMQLLDEKLGAKRQALFLADLGKHTLGIEATYGVRPEDFRPRLGQGVAGRVTESGRAIVVPAVWQDPMALCELADPSAWREERLSLVSVPVSVSGQGRGALSAYFRSGCSASFAARLQMLESVASAVAEGFASRPPEAPEDPSSKRGERVVFEYANMIGTSAPMRQVYEEIGQVAQTTATALILGESGTGKELVAQAIHVNSERARLPFIKVNAASFPETLFESELFGHERGAFTGAVGRKKGRIDWAQGGTLFLDEIAELPLSTQVKLLRVLQFREFERLGGTETVKADVRLVAATNKNMAEAVARGTFREDLFYRLNVFTINVPALRERAGDVPALAEYFLEKHARQHRRNVRRVATGALDLLCGYAWPGNVRELENAIERAVVVCSGLVLEERHLPEAIRASPRGSLPRKLSLAESVENLERRMIEDALRESEGNLARASRSLGTTERILRYKAGKYGLGQVRPRRAKKHR